MLFLSGCVTNDLKLQIIIIVGLKQESSKLKMSLFTHQETFAQREKKGKGR